MSKKYIALGLMLTVMGCQQQALLAARPSTGTRMRSAANSAVNRTVKAVSISDTTSELWNKGGFENKLKSIGSYLGLYKPKPAGSDTEPLRTDSEESSPTLAEQLSFANKFKRSGAEPKTLKLIDAAEQAVREQEDPPVQTEANPTPLEAASQVEGAAQPEATAAVKIQSTYRGYQSRKQPSTRAAQATESTRQPDLEPEAASPRETEEPAAQTVRASTEAARQPDSLLADKPMSAEEALAKRLGKKFQKVNEGDAPGSKADDTDADWFDGDSTTPRTDSGGKQLTLAEKLAAQTRAKDKLPGDLLVVEPREPNPVPTHERFSLSRFTELQGPEKHPLIKEFKELKKKFTNEWDEIDLAVKNTTLLSLKPETRREFEKYLVDPKKYTPPVDAAPVRVEVASPAASAARTSDAAESPRTTDDVEVAAASSRPALPPPPMMGGRRPAGAPVSPTPKPPARAAEGTSDAPAKARKAPTELLGEILGGVKPKRVASGEAASPLPTAEPAPAPGRTATEVPVANGIAAIKARLANQPGSPMSNSMGARTRPTATSKGPARKWPTVQTGSTPTQQTRAATELAPRPTEDPEAPERTLTMAERKAIVQAVLDRRSGQAPTAASTAPEAMKKLTSDRLAPELFKAAETADISKYRKMLSVGVPPAAVKAKMTAEGVDPALLDAPASTTAATTEVAPAETAVAKLPARPAFLGDISGGAGLAGLKKRTH